MYFVITERVYKIANMSGGQYDARTINTTKLTISGPFAKQIRAEKAMAETMAAHTTLSAQVYSAKTIVAMLENPATRDNVKNILGPVKKWIIDPATNDGIST